MDSLGQWYELVFPEIILHELA